MAPTRLPVLSAAPFRVMVDIAHFAPQLSFTSTVVDVDQSVALLEHWRGKDGLFAWVRPVSTAAPSLQETIDRLTVSVAKAEWGPLWSDLAQLPVHVLAFDAADKQLSADVVAALRQDQLVGLALRDIDSLCREGLSNWTELSTYCSPRSAELAAAALTQRVALFDVAPVALKGTAIDVAREEIEEQLDTLLKQFRGHVGPREVAAPPPREATADISALAKTRDSALEAAFLLRDRLLVSESWLSAPEVAARALGSVPPSNPSQPASRLRREGRLLGARLRGEYRHPAFQFTGSGSLHPRMQELLALLPDDDTGWPAVFWCFQRTGRLAGKRPADVFIADPGAVIEAARLDFEGDDGNW